MKTIKSLGNLEDKRILLRVDLNSNILKGKVLDSERFSEHAKTIEYLLKKKAKVVVLAHQGSVGKSNCISLKQHSEILKKYLGNKIKFCRETIGNKAWDEISSLKSGEAILLENTRFLKDEFKPSVKNHFVNFMEEVGINYYINDAFSILHRNQTSVVSFPKVFPHASGFTLMKELENIQKIKSRTKKCLFILGGAKSGDLIPLLKNPRVLTGGKLSLLALESKGYELGFETRALKQDKKLIPKIKRNLKNLEVPEDLAVNENGKRNDLILSSFPSKYPVLDIGEKTIEIYKMKIKNLKRDDAIFMKGVPGVFENPEFALGSREILKAVAKSRAFSVIAGGQYLDAIKILKIKKRKFNYVSLSGGSLVKYLAGEKLVGLDVLK